jgi:hypothetical protein
MLKGTCSTDQRSAIGSPIRARTGQQQTALRSRFGRVTVGFWLGGFVLGTVGGIVGASMSYSHPVARVASVLWWAIYFGCLGASLSALFALFTESTLPRPSRPIEDAEEPRTALARSAFPSSGKGFATGRHHRLSQLS